MNIYIEMNKYAGKVLVSVNYQHTNNIQNIKQNNK